jgi:hypothetical protein
MSIKPSELANRVSLPSLCSEIAPHILVSRHGALLVFQAFATSGIASPSGTLVRDIGAISVDPSMNRPRIEALMSRSMQKAEGSRLGAHRISPTAVTAKSDTSGVEIALLKIKVSCIEMETN